MQRVRKIKELLIKAKPVEYEKLLKELESLQLELYFKLTYRK